MVLGQALVAGSVVQGAKLRPRSPPSPPECGLGSKTVPLGQARPSVVRGEKLWSLVKRWWREVWFREPNCGLGSSPSPPKYGPGSQTAAQVTPCPAKVWSREQNRAPGSSQAPPECGLGSKTVPPGQARPRQSMV